MQLEWKIKTMKCSVQREAWDQKAVMKGDLEVEAPANEMQRSGETNSSWKGSLLRILLDIIKAGNDTKPLANIEITRLCSINGCVYLGL